MKVRGRTAAAAALLAALVAGCREVSREEQAESGKERAAPAAQRDASIYWDTARIPPEQLEAGRRDASWRSVVQLESASPGTPARPRERLDDLAAERVASGPVRLPLGGDDEGASVLRVQVLLDRALFSPGIIDARWGKNVEKAVYWFQKREALPATARVDSATYRRLEERAGASATIIREHRLTDEDVKGPFVKTPSDIYERAKLDCSCYESLAEKLAERFHTSPELLRKLNPGIDLENAAAGTALQVPAVRDSAAGQDGKVARIVVSDQGHFVHALDASGRILFHFPSTLGSRYSPSPSGQYTITSITREPWWHYQPALLEGKDPNDRDARIPPGPNSAVGMVWMDLSKPHFGIHGTDAPETIGYATSSGCVRLTNWDALFLAGRVEQGVPVEFRDTEGGQSVAGRY